MDLSSPAWFSLLCKDASQVVQKILHLSARTVRLKNKLPHHSHLMPALRSRLAPIPYHYVLTSGFDATHENTLSDDFIPKAFSNPLTGMKVLPFGYHLTVFASYGVQV